MKALPFAIATMAGLVLAGTVMAADIPPAAPPPYRAPVAVVPPYSWTGIYINAGGGYGLYSAEDKSLSSGAPLGVARDNGGRGYFGTVGGGFDFQISDRIVIGAFGDFDFSSIKGNASFNAGSLVGEMKQDWAWAAGGRIGWLITPTILSYFNGGYGQGNFKSVPLVSNLGAPTAFALNSQTYGGYFLGGGIEYNFWFPGLFMKSEYRLANYSASTVNIPGTLGPLSEQIRPYVQTYRTELIYRFNWR